MAEPIGYRSTVYGDDTTPLIEVYELDDDEQLTRILLDKAVAARQPLRLIKDELKPTEIGKLAELEATINLIKRECKHRVFKDGGGFPYYTRTCVACNAYMGSV